MPFRRFSYGVHGLACSNFIGESALILMAAIQVSTDEGNGVSLFRL